MDLLEVPLEAVAMRMYSTQMAGILFPWIAAALAAAVSFWGIRARAAIGVELAEAKKIPGAGAAADKRPELRAVPEPAPEEAPPTPSKVRFTAYYGGDKCDGCCSSRRVDDSVEQEEQADGNNAAEDFAGLRSPVRAEPARLQVSRSEMILTELAVRRRPDLGWYSFQDMSALNGNVVKLWDAVNNGGFAAEPLDRRTTTTTTRVLDCGYSSSLTFRRHNNILVHL